MLNSGIIVVIRHLKINISLLTLHPPPPIHNIHDHQRAQDQEYDKDNCKSTCSTARYHVGVFQLEVRTLVVEGEGLRVRLGDGHLYVSCQVEVLWDLGGWDVDTDVLFCQCVQLYAALGHALHEFVR